MTKEDATSTSLGFSPKVNPQPPYPSLVYIIKHFIFEVFWQGGIWGTVLFALLFPSYQRFYTFCTESYHISAPMFFCLMTSLSHTFCYAVFNLTFDYMDKHNILAKYKMERKPYQTPKPALRKKLFVEAIIGQLVTSPLTTYFLYPVFCHFGMLDFTAPHPTMQSLFFTFATAHMFNDVGFYFAHRLAHSKPIYAKIHKQHHEFAGTIGFAAEYAHPIEQIVCNQLPTVGGVLFFGCHPLCVWIWIALRLQQTYEAHSGYCFDGSILDRLGLSHAESSSFHDHHHTSNKGNFGITYMDYIFGTMDHYMVAGGHEGYVEKGRAAYAKKKKKK